MTKKIMIYAYTNFNLGDDLFIKVLCERYPATQFLLYAPRSYKKVFKNIKNIKIIPSDIFIVRGINYIFRKLNVQKMFVRSSIADKCDAGVYIGGSLFMQDEKWNEELENKKSMIIKNKPFFVLGANFGPYYDKQFYLEYKKMFLNYTDICFRDNYSYELFKELPNVRIADDIVFQLSDQVREKEQNGKNIVISVIKPSIRKHLVEFDQLYYEKIKDITKIFNEKGYKVTLMSFCENEGDKEAIESILKLLPPDNMNMITEHYYQYNLDETIRIISNSSFIVATRFHSMILGWLFNKPVFPIAYSEKMTNVMKDVGFNGLYTDFKHLEQITPIEVYKSMEKNKINIAKQVENSRHHFKELDKLLLN